jgi:hypothetical protein
MTGLQLYSERRPPVGGLPGSGVLNLLGRPSATPLETMVRESLQNSWDARLKSNADHIRFGLRLDTLEGDRLGALRSLVLSDIPAGLPELNAHLANDSLRVLIVSDRETTGLIGSTHADQIGRSPFCDFVYNWGNTQSEAGRGGTYGFGTSSFFLATQCRTIVVRSRCLGSGGATETRLIALALGSKTEQGGKVLTGRHWWGHLPGVDDDGATVVEPLVGAEAESIAVALGFEPLVGNDSGTDVMIIAPDLDVEVAPDDPALKGLERFGDDAPALAVMREAVLVHFWPKLMETQGARDIDFVLSVGEEVITRLDPENHPWIAGFVLAMRAFDANDPAYDAAMGIRRGEVRSGRPIVDIGRWVVRTSAASHAAFSDAAVGIKGVPHHIAVMRGPRNVVKYVQGPPHATDGLEYAGVFVASADAENALTQAETPTHDDWVAKGQEFRTKVIVNTVFKQLDAAMREIAEPPRRQAEVEDAAVSVAAFSTSLATSRMLAGLGAAFVNRQPLGPGGTRTKSDRIKVREAEPTLSMENGRRTLNVPFTITEVPDAVTRVALELRSGIVLDDGKAVADDRLGIPDWTFPDGTTVNGEHVVDFAADLHGGDWLVSIGVPDDAIVAAAVHAAPAAVAPAAGAGDDA